MPATHFMHLTIVILHYTFAPHRTMHNSSSAPWVIRSRGPREWTMRKWTVRREPNPVLKISQDISFASL